MNVRRQELFGRDPFADISDAAEAHRLEHGDVCGVYLAGADVMRLAATFARAAEAKRILDLGSGFGYSALWLADGAGAEGRVLGIDRFPEHLVQAREFADAAGLGERIEFRAGEVVDLLPGLEGPFDLIHDDGWFAAEPAYFEAMLALLRPGGVLTMPNWFLLEDALPD